MDKKAETHDRILRAASTALRRNGFDGVGVSETMKGAGLTHGGFYAHFASHEGLLVEALERAGQDGDQALRDAVAEAVQRPGGPSPFRALVEVYLSEVHAASREGGCTMAALGSELSRQTEAVLTVGKQRVQSVISLVRSSLPGHPEWIETVAAAMVGALQMARILGSEEGGALLAAVRKDLLERFDVRSTSR